LIHRTASVVVGLRVISVCQRSRALAFAAASPSSVGSRVAHGNAAGHARVKRRVQLTRGLIQGELLIFSTLERCVAVVRLQIVRLSCDHRQSVKLVQTSQAMADCFCVLTTRHVLSVHVQALFWVGQHLVSAGHRTTCRLPTGGGRALPKTQTLP
jgi:hypothetical protein